MTPPVTASDDTPTGYLSLRGYSEYTGKHERTVKRWLADHELPGAYQDNNGRWLIPASAVRTPHVEPANGAGTVLTLNGHRQDGPSVHVAEGRAVLSWPQEQQPVEHATLVDAQVERLPTLMTLDEALAVLNYGRPEDDPLVTRHGLINNAEFFGVVKVGAMGKYLMPLATIKKLRGLTP